MWQGVCSHLSRWYPYHVVCARVHHLTCAFTHMQRIHGSMLDSLSVSMSLSGARIRVGVMGNVWALNHCSKCKSSKYASDSYSFPPCVSLFRLRAHRRGGRPAGAGQGWSAGSRRGGAEGRPGALDGNTQHLTVQCFLLFGACRPVFSTGFARRGLRWYQRDCRRL